MDHLRRVLDRIDLCRLRRLGGPNLWLVDLVAPSALAGSMLKDLDEKVAQGRPIAAQAVSSDGTATLTTVRALLAGLEKEPA